MNPARKRVVRLTVALSAAVVLAGALIYTSFSAASPALSPSELLSQVQPGRPYQLRGAGASAVRGRSGRRAFAESGRRAMFALAGILTVAFAVLEIAFLRNAFAFNTVADTSSRTTPAAYRAAAVWSSQEGSLLLWAW